MRISAKILMLGLLVHGLAACGDAGGDGTEVCTPASAEVLDEPINGEDVVLGQCTLVTQRIGVNNGGSVTVEPGSTVFFERAAGFWILRDSAINAVGTEEEPILFTGVEKEPGAWRSIDLEDANSTDNVFEHVTIEYGGGDAFAALQARGEAVVAVRNSTIRHSESAGFQLPNGTAGEVRAFEENTVVDNALVGIAGPSSAGMIASSNTLTGNEEDWVRLEPRGAVLEVTEEVTFSALDVPYLLSSSMNIFGGGLWTVEAGAEVAVAPNSAIKVGHDGAMSLAGTADAPVLIRGQESAPGIWNNIYIENSGSTNNLIAHTTIADAGAGGSDDAAALWLGSGETHTMRLSLDTVTIRDSAGHGVYANDGYEGAFAVTGCETVSFENIAGDEFAGDPVCTDQ